MIMERNAKREEHSTRLGSKTFGSIGGRGTTSCLDIPLRSGIKVTGGPAAMPSQSRAKVFSHRQDPLRTLTHHRAGVPSSSTSPFQDHFETTKTKERPLHGEPDGRA
jgi:hypothetical protein